MHFAIWGLMVLFAAAPVLADEPADIPYTSLDEAWADLSAKPGVTIEDHGIWRVIFDRPEITVWTFTAPGNPAHPSMVKRTAYEEDGAWYSMSFIRCKADKPTCDKLRDDFAKLDEQIKEDISRSNNRP
ncbi:MAG: hypothetical protein KF895_08250 [Parvibaculum sp.]|nr:hypothetical protein [Parvibaculum sp.]